MQVVSVILIKIMIQTMVKWEMVLYLKIQIKLILLLFKMNWNLKKADGKQTSSLKDGLLLRHQ